MFPSDEEYEAFQGDKWWEEKELDVLCFALRIKKEATLPTVDYEIPETVGALGSALSQHYQSIGKPLHGKTAGDILKGYHHLTGVNKDHIECILDQNTPKTSLDF